MPEHRHRRSEARGLNDLSALGKDSPGVFGQQSDQLLAIGPARVGTRQRTLAQEVLGARHEALHPQVDRRHRPVGVLADDDVALLRAQHVHRLGAVRRDAVRSTGLHQRFPHGPTVIGRHVDLVGELAREAHAQNPRRHAGHGAAVHAQEGERLA